MNLIYRYIRKTLWQNKLRTIVTICGIILSVALFTAVTTSVSSVRLFLLDVIRSRLAPGQQEQVVLDYETKKMLYILMSILLTIVMIGSISLIYNAFAISVGERRHQYGILSSMGATRRQLRKSVFYEAALLGIVGIPIGVITGIGGITITFHLLGDQFSRFLSDGKGLTIHMQASAAAIVLAIVISMVTLYLSAWIPARRAIRVSAIEAIRQNQDIRIAARSVKTSSLTRRLFHVEGELASKNFKRNKKRYRATILSLSISVLLFIATSSFCEFFQRSLNGIYADADADIMISEDVWAVESDSELKSTLTDEKIKECYGHIASMSGVKEAVSACWYNVLYMPDNAGYDEAEDVMLVFVEDEKYREWLLRKGYDVNTYIDGNQPEALVMNEVVRYDSEKEKYVTSECFDKGDFTMTLYMPERLDVDFEQFCNGNEKGYRKLTIHAGELDNSDDRLLGLGQNKGMAKVLLPEHCIKEVAGDIPGEKNYAITAENPDLLYEEICTYLKSSFIHKWESALFVLNIFNEKAIGKAVMTVMRVFGFGFIILLSLIAIANVFNTISTGIMLRRREFAVLRSIGMTKKGFQRMMIFECLIYGFKGLLYGLILGFGAHILVWKTLGIKLEGQFFIPWNSVGIAVITVFTVVFITVFYSMRKMPIEHLAEEIRAE